MAIPAMLPALELHVQVLLCLFACGLGLLAGSLLRAVKQGFPLAYTAIAFIAAAVIAAVLHAVGVRFYTDPIMAGAMIGAGFGILGARRMNANSIRAD